MSAARLGVIAALAALAPAVAPAPAAARDLTIVSFGGSLQDAVRAAFVKPFAEATKTPVAEDTYDGALSAVSAQVEAKSVKWDVVDVEPSELIQGCQEGYFERIDRAGITEAGQLVPAALGTSPCGVGYMVGAMVLAYDGAKLAKGPTTWAQFWDLKSFPGKRGLKFGPKWTLELALMADGVEPAKLYDVLATPAGVDRAFRKLDEIKPSIAWWKLGAESIQALASGEVALTSAYNGRVVAANRGEKRKFAMAWDAGSVAFMDYFAVVKGSPNREAATRFIDAATKAGAQREFPKYIGYGPTNLAAFQGMDPAIAAELPDTERMKHAATQGDQFWLDHNDELTQRFNVWAAK